jgi:16S rRNA (guanine1207-N2)-methyltransferase
MPVPSLVSTSDPALDALFVPFERGDLVVPTSARVWFLGARDGAALRRHATAGWTCAQSFKPYADALNKAGLRVLDPACIPDAAEDCDIVLVLPPRQRDEARALFAQASRLVSRGGLVVASVANAEGARTAESDLRCLAGPLGSLQKHHCRVFWTRSAADPVLSAAWQALDRMREIEGGWISRPGLFAWDRIDTASLLLAEALPPDLAGRAADLGAGWGYLSAELLRGCAGIRSVDLFEAEARALEAARSNLARANRERVAAGRDEVDVAVHWHDVGSGIPGRFDVVVSNPPFHIRRADVPDLGRSFIAAAADALVPDGRLLLVANRHLPYEEILGQRFRDMRMIAGNAAFKVLQAQGLQR